MSVESNTFNASIVVTELLMNTLESCAKDLASRCIKECGKKYSFDAEEEIRALGLESLSVIRKKMAKKSVSVSVKKEKVAKENKSKIPLPFIAEMVDIAGCQGLVFNRGLFTQCPKKVMDNGNYCKGCQTESDKNASGCPDCGTVESRLASGLYEFKDPKGRNPTPYLKVLEKLKVTVEDVTSDFERLNICVDQAHFDSSEKKAAKSKGRPKKVTAAIEADNVTDLFAKLTSEDNDEVFVNEDVTETQPKKTTKLSDEEKAAKKAVLEAERATKKALAQQQREAKLAEEKAEREVKRKAEIEQKKLEREAKIAEEKAEREAKRLAEKALAQQQREAKKAAEKAEAELKKASKGKKSEAKSDAHVAAKADAPDAPVAAKADAPVAPGKVSVCRIQIGSKQYFKSSNNILYHIETKEEVGIWDPETKTIKALPIEEEEEEEEEEEQAEEYETI